MRAWQILLIVVVAFIIGAIVAGIGLAGWVLRVIEPPRDIAVVIDMPDGIARGREFTFTIRIDNSADRQQTLDSIDVSNEFLAAVKIMSTEPAFVGMMPLRLFDEISYDYGGLPIPPGGSLLISVKAVPESTGQVYSYIDVCINTGMSCRTVPIAANVQQ